jgi:very-short-patch-repair endonuclease
MEICKICNESFKSRRSLIYHLKNFHKIPLKEYYISYNNLKIEKCLFCDNDVSWHDRKLEYNKTCSNKTCIAKYAKMKSDQAVKEKYGVDNVFSLKEVIKKSKETKKERYDDENYNNTEKNKQTCIKRYGVDNGSKTEYAKEIISEKNRRNKDQRLDKMVKTFKENYGVNWNSKVHSISEKIHKSLKETNKQISINKIEEMGMSVLKDNFYSYDLKCNKCETIRENVLRPYINYHYRTDKKLCNKCNFHEKFRSNGEKELGKEISKISNEQLEFNKKMFGYEVDICISSKKLCFEYNGIYWHSELYKDKNYHKDKKNKFLENGWDLIYIWEDDWNNQIKKDIIISKIKSIFKLNEKIYAKNCDIKEITHNEAKDFLEKNHLTGYANSSIRIGLFNKDNLVMLLTFCKTGNKNQYKLLRTASLNNITIIDGFDKIIKYFIKHYGNKLYSYIDFDWFISSSYLNEQSNFKFIKHNSTIYYWALNGIRKNKIEFKKDEKLDKNLSKKEIMYSNGYYRVYNSGNLTYEL